MATADRPGWRTSSFTDNGQSCVEVDPGADWRTSSFTGNGESCIEVAPGPRSVRVRDTKDRCSGPVLTLGPAAWAAFRAAALSGEPLTGVLTIAVDTRTTEHAGTVRATSWHVTHDGTDLHFTEAERIAFARGVRAGEFSFVAA